MKEYIGTHKNLVFTAIAVVALASYVTQFNNIAVPVFGTHADNFEAAVDAVSTGEITTQLQKSINDLVDQDSDDNDIDREIQDLAFTIDIVGGNAVNIARNLASFQDSSFNTLTQTNDQSTDGVWTVQTQQSDTHSTGTPAVLPFQIDVAAPSLAANIGVNDAEFINSDNNVVDQSNNQEIRDVSEGSGQVLSGLPAHIRIRTVEGAEAATVVPVPIFSIEAQSGAANVGINRADFQFSDSNTVTQTNDQSIEDVSDESLAVNIGINDGDVDGRDFLLWRQDNDQSIDDVSDGSFAANVGINRAVFEKAKFEEVLVTGHSQANSQNIQDVSKGSLAANIGINDADFDNSNFNTATQSNTQSIDDIEGDSQAANSALNSADLAAWQDQFGSQSNTQSIDDISIGSQAANIGVNNLEATSGTENDVSQSNDQNIENVKKGSSADNTASNNARPIDIFGQVTLGPIDQSNTQDIDEVKKDSSAENDAENNAELDDSDDNDVSQSNDQDIKDVDDDSEASNTGVNNAEFEDSDDNQVSQSNDQEIDDVNKGSSGSNDAENSVSLE